MTIEELPERVRISRLADYWDCSASTIYRLINERQLEAIRVNNSIRIPREEVARYEKKNKLPRRQGK